MPRDQLILTGGKEDASRRRYELETGLAMDVQCYVEKPYQGKGSPQASAEPSGEQGARVVTRRR